MSLPSEDVSLSSSEHSQSFQNYQSNEDSSPSDDLEHDLERHESPLHIPRAFMDELIVVIFLKGCEDDDYDDYDDFPRRLKLSATRYRLVCARWNGLITGDSNYCRSHFYICKLSIYHTGTALVDFIRGPIQKQLQRLHQNLLRSDASDVELDLRFNDIPTEDLKLRDVSMRIFISGMHLIIPYQGQIFSLYFSSNSPTVCKHFFLLLSHALTGAHRLHHLVIETDWVMGSFPNYAQIVQASVFPGYDALRGTPSPNMLDIKHLTNLERLTLPWLSNDFELPPTVSQIVVRHDHGSTPLQMLDSRKIRLPPRLSLILHDHSDSHRKYELESSYGSLRFHPNKQFKDATGVTLGLLESIDLSDISRISLPSTYRFNTETNDSHNAFVVNLKRLYQRNKAVSKTLEKVGVDVRNFDELMVLHHILSSVTAIARLDIESQFFGDNNYVPERIDPRQFDANGRYGACAVSKLTFLAPYKSDGIWALIHILFAINASSLRQLDVSVGEIDGHFIRALNSARYLTDDSKLILPVFDELIQAKFEFSNFDQTETLAPSGKWFMNSLDAPKLTTLELNFKFGSHKFRDNSDLAFSFRFPCVHTFTITVPCSHLHPDFGWIWRMVPNALNVTVYTYGFDDCEIVTLNYSMKYIIPWRMKYFVCHWNAILNWIYRILNGNAGHAILPAVKTLAISYAYYQSEGKDYYGTKPRAHALQHIQNFVTPRYSPFWRKKNHRFKRDMSNLSKIRDRIGATPLKAVPSTDLLSVQRSYTNELLKAVIKPERRPDPIYDYIPVIRLESYKAKTARNPRDKKRKR